MQLHENYFDQSAFLAWSDAANAWDREWGVYGLGEVELKQYPLEVYGSVTVSVDAGQCASGGPIASPAALPCQPDPSIFLPLTLVLNADSSPPPDAAGRLDTKSKRGAAEAAAFKKEWTKRMEDEKLKHLPGELAVRFGHVPHSPTHWLPLASSHS